MLDRSDELRKAEARRVYDKDEYVHDKDQYVTPAVAELAEFFGKHLVGWPMSLPDGANPDEGSIRAAGLDTLVR
jgi:hypothetical protein